MTASELRDHVKGDSERYYFDPETMKFWGDTMANYGVRDVCECWELYRRKPVTGRHGNTSTQSSAYFAKDDYRRVHPDGITETIDSEDYALALGHRPTAIAYERFGSDVVLTFGTSKDGDTKRFKGREAMRQYLAVHAPRTIVFWLEGFPKA